MSLRSFIAVPFSSEFQEAITSQTSALRRSLERSIVRWIPPSNIHLTLKFLGNVQPDNLEKLAQSLVAETKNHACFRMTLGGIGVFPNRRHPRIIWIGINAPDNLRYLFQSIERITSEYGHAQEKRPFSPHLTIGRVNQHITANESRKIAQALTEIHVEELGEATVDSICIFRSDLKPTGAVYTHLYTAQLSL